MAAAGCATRELKAPCGPVASPCGEERVDGVVVGDPAGFLVETLKARQTVSIRPEPGASPSNLTITTTGGVYHFRLLPEAYPGDASFGVVIDNSAPPQSFDPRT